MEREITQLSGTMKWNLDHADEAKIKRFILRPHGFAFEIEHERSNYTGTFTEKSPWQFQGVLHITGAGGIRKGHGTCSIATTEDGYTLSGEWFESDEHGTERRYPEWRADLWLY